MATGRWVKIYTKILWDPTIRKLTCTQKWVFVTLIILADEGAGVLSGDAATTSHVTFAAGSDALTVKKILRILEENSLITIRKSGDIVIANWQKYQSTTAARRGRKKRQTAAPEVEVDKSRIDKIIELWQKAANLQQPQKINREVRSAVGYRLKEGATVDEIKGVLEWYDGQLADPTTFWGGHNERGSAVKFNIIKVMKGKLSDRITRVYEHFLAASKSKKVPGSRTGRQFNGAAGDPEDFIR